MGLIYNCRASGTPDSPSILLTVPEAARLLSLSNRTVWGLARSGKLRRIRIGRSLRIRRSDVETLIEASSESAPQFRGRVGEGEA